MAAYDRGSFAEAESMLLVAAHAGHPNAQELLGFMYAVGPGLFPGTWRSLTAARNWFERAARAGRPAAECMHIAFIRHGMLEVRADINASFNLAATEPADSLFQAPASDPGRPAPPAEE
jgi:TPR repeat protein